MDLKNNKIIQSLGYGLVEKVFDILISMITSIIVIRMLSRYEYGMLSSIVAYASTFAIFNVAPENYLFKVFSYIDKKKLSEYFKSYMIFDIINGLIILVFYIILGIILSFKYSNWLFFFVSMASGIVVLLNQVYNLSRVISDLNYNQKYTTKITFVTKVIRLAITCVLFFYNYLIVILIRDILTALIQSIIIYFSTREYVYNSVTISNDEIISNLKEALFKFSIINHIIGVLTGLIYNIDPIILGIFADMEVVGTYSIALNCTNYFIIIFQLIQQNTTIALGNCTNVQDENIITTRFSIMSILIGLIQFLIFALIGKYYLRIYVGNIEVTEVYTYAMYILAGLTIFNCIRPYSSYLIIKYDIKKYFKKSIIPTFIFTMIVYIISAKFYGSYGLAVANFFAYSFWSITQIALLVNSRYRFIINKENLNI